jgi:hypothetical protein
MLKWLRDRFGIKAGQPDPPSPWPKYWVPPRGGLYSAPDDRPLHAPTGNGLRPGATPESETLWPKYWIPPRGGLYSAPDDRPLHAPVVPETRGGLSPLPK